VVDRKGGVVDVALLGERDPVAAGAKLKCAGVIVVVPV
jgi:hypothetical protein